MNQMKKFILQVSILLLLLGILFFSQNAKATAIVVTNNAASGVGSFDAAITFCNGNAGTAPHTITFNAALDGLVIPSITGNALTCPSVTIDGTTMPSYTCGNPRVMLTCNAFNGWQLTGSGCVIKGVRINGGVQLNGTGGHKVVSCLFNIDFAGAAMATGAKACVRTNVAGTINNIIGGLTSCEKNVMASMGAFGIIFDASGNGNQVLGNYIGTDITGLVALGTGFTTKALDIEAGSNHIFDGNTVGNVVSSSQGYGLMINGGTGHQIRNNNFGANVNRLFVASLAFGTAASGSNVIYFNGSNGSNSVLTNNVVGNSPFITSAGIAGNLITVEGPTNVQLLNNYVGCDVAFNSAGSSWAGIYYLSSCVGGTITGNYIGNNGITSTQRSHGIAIYSCSGTFTISNNYIGVTPAGGNMGNGDAGLELNVNAGAIFNITGNYIGFNKAMRALSPGSLTSESGAIRIISGQTVTISNNYIGTLSGGRANCGNLQMGIGIEGTTGTGITINNNTIAYNGRNAIQTYGNGSDKVMISQNCIFCNANEGIELTNGTIGSPTAGIGNNSYGRAFATVDGAKTTVQLSTGFAAWQCDFSGATWILRGYAPANDVVEIFQIHHCGCDGTNQTTTVSKANGTQGLDYIATVTADAQGRWTYSLPQNTVKNGFTVTSTNVASKRTSEFSPCVSVTPTCLPPTSVTIAGSTSITPCIGDPFTLTGTTTLVRTSCYNNIYYTWLKNGVVIYGPSLTYLDYSVVSSVDPGDDGLYVLRSEDGNAGLAACYKAATPGTTVDVINCAMKISLLDFRGSPFSEYNKLSWTVEADEPQTIELQSSMDGKSFYTLSSYYSLTSSKEEVNDYTKNPITYYRLKITSSGGEESFSKIIVLNKNSNLTINVINTKAEDYLNLQIISNSDQMIHYSIYDTRGIVMLESSLQVNSGVTNSQVFVGNLNSAIYLIKFSPSNYNEIETKKFMH